MSVRAKVAANSPYNTGNTDVRTFPETDGEILTAEKFIALADDLQAIVDRLVVAESGLGGGSSGGFDIPYTQILINSPGNNLREGRCEWVKNAQGLVHAQIHIAEMNTSGTTYIRIVSADLLAQGLPEPVALSVPVSGAIPRIVPVSGVVIISGVIRPIQYALWDVDDVGDGFEISLASSVTVREGYFHFAYQS